MNQHYKGIIYAFIAYLLWGVLPIYWKLVEYVSPLEILAHRIIWSFITITFFVILSKKWNSFISLCKELLTNRKKLFALILAALLISGNWFIYIWAVNSNHIIEASLGYYINPLVSILLGVFVLKERLSIWQLTAVVIAFIGVIYLTVNFGKFPFISFLLAITFALYALLKKMINLDATFSLLLETAVVFPIALIYFGKLAVSGHSGFINGSLIEIPLLIGAGIATILPLLYFGKAAQLIPLSYIGIMQYIAPTISLIIGTLLYHEKFTKTHLISFLFIWTACILFAFAKTKTLQKLEMRIFHKKENQNQSA
ncbi:EamA family transporter RarD [Bacillus sp. RG28]|uniref:EamA family transporter RarD n=1 Tax=Gottfriedia endophytica TaxID=2820819 RepID=A0A940NI82_9BACI|nr:EamA family transporter RarD [Gottfriedia endophytica]MBP0725859.1 EamA family transporter RarD [Gottfriedia endophytica]